MENTKLHFTEPLAIQRPESILNDYIQEFELTQRESSDDLIPRSNEEHKGPNDNSTGEETDEVQFMFSVPRHKKQRRNG